ncbi:putative 2-dehydropantoate 2-reductase [Cercospora beticola]|uniref:2-dehydropantoate 2-reductase n=1 Tax=Cercospora beticola TaxID=122368 RepID=A0A2G5IDM5_CERBT|nr:putative 2-dehydropantoate 2-reductase [Cercospora beticola]PIB02901.1 putative 2-dehydropantoate 2-reductase [Cercospora beticola]WPB04458.1 hypothetical protein RHO25_009104 [Cercospora beticola]
MSSSGPRILLHGTGGVGAVYAYQLLKGGADVTAICRSNYEAVKDNGILIDSDIYGKGLHINPKVARTPQEAAENGPYDYLLVATKAFPESKTSETIAPAVTPGKTTIALLQNGVGIEQEYAERFPENTLLSCVIYQPTTQISPGHVRHGNFESFATGPFPASAHENPSVKASGEKLVEILNAGGGNATYHSDIQELRWSKLLLNVPFNSITALTLARDLPFLASSELAEPVVKGVLDEVVAISQALGYKNITKEGAYEGLAKIMARKGTLGIEYSMLTDVLHARKMEHEVILGNPVRTAQKLGVQVPRMEMLYALVKALDLAQQKRKPGQSLDCEDLGTAGAS